jgi:phosphate transport system protein
LKGKNVETHFQQEMNQLKSELVGMAGLVERAISNAVEALVKRDTPLAEKTIREDVQVNDLELSIDDRCLKLLIFLNQEPQLKPYIDIPEMAEITQNMLRDVLNAFVKQDAVLARSVCERDDRVDGLNNQVFRELLTYMMADPKTITRAVHLIIVSRCLERIADHATNIAEGVIFMAQAKIIKHHADAEPQKWQEKR